MPRAATVWLVGMMGAGKSAVGRRLAARLGRRFVDTDEEVERAAGRSIAELFAREGEPAFRALERAAIARVAGKEAVVAVGGGAIAQPGAAAAMAAAGTIVWLRARPETLLGRVGPAGERPLLAGLDPAAQLARLRALLAEREPSYAAAALAVDTDGLAPEEVAEAVARELEERGA
jgi:shikimate kinase